MGKKLLGVLTAVLLVAIPVATVYFARNILVLQFIDDYLDKVLHVRAVREVTLGNMTTLAFSDVVVAGKDDHLIQIESLRFTIAMRPLILQSKIELQDLKAIGVTLRLHEMDDLEAKPAAPVIDRQWLQQLSVHLLEAQNVTVLYRDADQDIKAHLNLVTVQQPNPNGASSTPLRMVVSGKLNELPFRVAGDIASSTPFSPLRDIAVNLNLSWGTLTAKASGRLDPNRWLNNSEISLTLSSPTARPLLDLIGASEVRDGSINAAFSIAKDGQAANVQASASVSEFVGSVSAIVRSQNQFEAVVKLSGPSLYEAGATMDYLNFSAAPFQIEGQIRRRGSVVTASRVKLSLAEGLLSGRASFPQFPEIAGAEVNLRGKDFSPIIFGPMLPGCSLPDEPMLWQVLAERNAAGLDDIDVSIEGKTHRLLLRGQPENQLDFSLQGATMKELGRCLNDLQLPDEPVHLTGNLYTDYIDWHIPQFNITSALGVVAGNVHWVDNTVDTTISLASDNLKASLQRFGISSGPLAGLPAAAVVQVQGPPNDLTLTSAKMTLDDQATISLAGKLGDIRTLESLVLKATAQGLNLRTILPDPESEETRPQPFEAKANITFRNGHWRVRDLTATIVKTTLQGDLRFPPDMVSSASVNLEVEGANLKNLFGPWISYPLPGLPFRFSVQMDHNPQRLNIPLLEGNVGDHRFSMQLLLDDPPDLSSTSGFVAMNGPSSIELSALLNQSIDHIDSAYELRTSIGASRDTVSIRDFSLKLGESTIEGDLEWRPSDVPFIHANIESSALHLPTFFPALAPENQQSKRESAQLFDATPIAMDWLKQYEGDVTFHSDNVYSDKANGTAVTVRATVGNGILQTSSLDWRGLYINGQASLTVDASGDIPGITLDTTSSRIPLLWLLGGNAMPSSTDTLYVMSLRTKGTSVATWMKHLNGQIIFNGGGGQLKQQGLDWLFGDFISNVGRTLVQREPTAYTTIHCTAAGMQIDNGLATFDPALTVRTDKLDIFVTGKLNLSTEVPELLINTRSRTGLGISVGKVLSPRTRVSGTLAKPQMQPDVARSALSGSAAYLSAGMSILAAGIFDRIRAGAVNPCQNVFEAAATKVEFANMLKAVNLKLKKNPTE